MNRRAFLKRAGASLPVAAFAAILPRQFASAPARAYRVTMEFPADGQWHTWSGLVHWDADTGEVLRSESSVDGGPRSVFVAGQNEQTAYKKGFLHT